MQMERERGKNNIRLCVLYTRIGNDIAEKKTVLIRMHLSVFMFHCSGLCNM